MVSQGVSAISANPLILGGTTEATALCRAMGEAGLRGTVSFAGRVERPRRQPLPQRVGGFGGVDGLARYLKENAVTHLIDATHPFASQMSRNAVEAAKITGIPLIAMTRPPWVPVPGDRWTRVPGTGAAVSALQGASRRVLLAVGRQSLQDFAANPQHFYLLRVVDPPVAPLPFPDCEAILDRGPFEEPNDRALMQRFAIDLMVSKNSGGPAAYAKIAAARALGLPVIMIDRPPVPARQEVGTPEAVIAWLSHGATDLGV
ncbi:MAG: cobalt-precorrin-6A reductase [Pseudomonadota bacterium]